MHIVSSRVGTTAAGGDNSLCLTALAVSQPGGLLPQALQQEIGGWLEGLPHLVYSSIFIFLIPLPLLLLLLATSCKSSGSVSAQDKREMSSAASSSIFSKLRLSSPKLRALSKLSEPSACSSCGRKTICQPLTHAFPLTGSSGRSRLSESPWGLCLHSPSPQNWLKTAAQLEEGVERVS